MSRLVISFMTVLLLVGCYRSSKSGDGQGDAGVGNGDTETSAGGDSDADTDNDADTDSDSDTDADNDTDTDTDADADTDTEDECVTDDDCNGPFCCGCGTYLSCLQGQCVDNGIELCADAMCCFVPTGCGPNCEVIPPYPEYDGTCGDIDCSGFESPLDTFYVFGCCTGDDTLFATEADKCGVDISLVDDSLRSGTCVQLARPGVLDPSCPDRASFPWPGKGCCTEAGFCGVMMTDQGLGCTYPDFTPGIGCSYPDGGPGNDAGG